MKRLLWIVAVAALVGACKSEPPPPAPEIADLLPLHAGRSWSYGVSRDRTVQVAGSDPATTRRLETHTVKVLGTTEDFAPDVWRLHTTVALDTTETEEDRFQHRVQAIAVRDNNLVLVAQWGVGRKSERRDLIKFDPPVTLVDLDAAVGEKWMSEPVRVGRTIARLESTAVPPQPVYLLSATIEDTRTIERRGPITGKLLLDGRALQVVSGQHTEKEQFTPGWALLRRETTRTVEIRRADGKTTTLTETVKARLKTR